VDSEITTLQRNVLPPSSGVKINVDIFTAVRTLKLKNVADLVTVAHKL
jgi:hypothetical protein